MQTLRTTSAPCLTATCAGSGPCVILLHGIGGNRSNWNDQVEFLASKGYFAIAPDLRGYGDSEDYDGPLDFISDFSLDVARVLSTAKVDQAHVVGLSMGGRIARWFYNQAPQRVLSLTLANTQPGFDALGAQATEDFVAARLAPLNAGHDPSDIAHDLARGLIGVGAVPGAYDRLVASMSALHRNSYMKTVRASVAQDRGYDLTKIAVPTMVLAGAEDKLYTPALAEGMAQKIPGARLKVLPHAGHLSNLEQPDLFNATLLEFLSSL